MGEITISIERYDELLDIETRVNVVADLLDGKEFVTKETILRIIGTEKAIDVADRIKIKDKELSFKEMLDD